jgi:primosomal protein N'
MEIPELIVKLPLYANNQKITERDGDTDNFIQSYKVVSIDENNYFKNMDDFKKYLIDIENINYNTELGLKKLQELTETYKELIDENRPIRAWHISYYVENREYIAEMPTDYLRDKYKQKLKDLENYDLKTRVKKCGNFIKTNFQQIIDFQNECKQYIGNKESIDRAKWNKNYYEKKKQLLGIKDKKILTEEERENYQKNYYERKKQEKGIKNRVALTEEERENYQKNYYEKKKQEKGVKSRTILTDEERKEYQRNYYLKRKEEKLKNELA